MPCTFGYRVKDNNFVLLRHLLTMLLYPLSLFRLYRILPSAFSSFPFRHHSPPFFPSFCFSSYPLSLHLILFYDSCIDGS
jgi:hypothetical protein